ncbi:hypothetical protein halTADL_0800 [Halohasta litchfieldiae]|jgi:hypothetical protein|uniref:DUF8056 domain-containing protein n=1 Tax=Halohasta litchfieldiae TaxID=1073996 RepID=A0A1H6VBE0_9EURY|nr:hypothetical protein [Halohasta litchfieldiae]ATW87598.1 hypothetical protein halTADL_0800 [Halohasta litchfieldiae]SEI97602.1 hypothetical protein SAMN05444271_11455 [Halohasta litchfieldiae]
MADGYRGLFGAFPYAFRHGDSRIFKLYVIFGALGAIFIGGLFTLSLVVWIGQTASSPGGSLTLSRTFIAVVGLFAAGPLLAPILLVARKHRRGFSYHPRYDTIMALLGVGFLLSIYVAAIISIPECFELDGEQICRDPASGLFGPIVNILYLLPQIAAVGPPAIMMGVMALGHYLLSR